MMKARHLLGPLLAVCLAALAGAVPMTVQVAEGRGGMVAAGHPDATAAGVAVLRAGGNAVDAAVAIGFALGVTEPYGSGMGGKLALVYRDAKTGAVSVVEALDEAPSRLNEKQFRQLPVAERSSGGPSVAVPGFVAGMLEAHARWGSRPRAELIAPAIKLAEKGFEVRQTQVRFFRSQEKKLRANPELGRLYLPDDRPPEAGARLLNPDLGRILRAVAEKGADGFYKGPVAQTLVAGLRAADSPVLAEDFANYRARVTTALHVRFLGLDVYSAPPPVSGGGVYLLTLAALENAKPPGDSVLDPDALDHVMRMYLAADTACREILGDRSDSRASWEKLLGEKQLSTLRAQALSLSTTRTTSLSADDGFEANAAETTHFVVVDKAGNVVSATQSQSSHFGSGIVPPGSGLVLNNSLGNFNRTTGNPNEIKAGHRPRTTIAPAVIVRDGRLVAGLGLPGGSRIPSAMVQVTTDYLLFGRSLEEAIAAPRFHPVTRRANDPENRFETERETDYRVAEALRQRFGWKDGTDAETESFGGVNAVEVMPDGRLRGYADQRRSNTAMGY